MKTRISNNNPKIGVLVIAHKRTEHLRRVLDALASAHQVEDCIFLILLQDASAEVRRIVENSELPNMQVKENNRDFESIKQAINSNVFVGLEYIFEDFNCQQALVLEDDIVVSADFITFMCKSNNQFKNKPLFRGINGFSTFDSRLFRETSLRVSSGLGWGWSINLNIYQELRKFWNGTEDQHWDFLIEPFIRTGFVVQPTRSRVLNIGFDETATHSGGNKSLENLISASFYVSDPVIDSKGNSLGTLKEQPYIYRPRKTFTSLKRIIIYRILFVLYRFSIYINRAYFGLRRKLTSNLV